MPLNLSDILKREYVSNYFKRNNKIFLVSFIIFILFALTGPLIFDVEDILGETMIDNSLNTLKVNDDILNDESYGKVYYENYDQDSDYSVDDIINNLFEDYSYEGFINLFLYNFSIDFSCILGGFLFSIPSLILTFINAAQIGVIFAELDFIIILWELYLMGYLKYLLVYLHLQVRL